MRKKVGVRRRERERWYTKRGCVNSEKEGGGEKERERWYTKRGCVNSEKEGGGEKEREREMVYKKGMCV